MPVAGIACLCSSHLQLKVAMLSAQGQVKPPRLVLDWLTSWISLQSRAFCKIKAVCLWSCGLQERFVMFVWHCICVPFNNHGCYLFWRWYWALRQVTTLLTLFSSPSSLHNEEGHVPLSVNTYFLEDFFLLVVIGMAIMVSKSNLLDSTSICTKHLQMVQKCSGTLTSPSPTVFTKFCLKACLPEEKLRTFLHAMGFYSQLPPGYGILLAWWKPNRPFLRLFFFLTTSNDPFQDFCALWFLSFLLKLICHPQGKVYKFLFVILYHSFWLSYLDSAVVNPSLILHDLGAIRHT